MREPYLNKNRKHILRGSLVLSGEFFCAWCYQSFDDRPSKKEHEEVCKKLGYTRKKRPQKLTKHGVL